MTPQDPLDHVAKTLTDLWDECRTVYFADDCTVYERFAYKVVASLKALTVAKSLIAALSSIRMPDDATGRYIPDEPTAVTLGKMLDDYREFSKEFNNTLNQMDSADDSDA